VKTLVKQLNLDSWTVSEVSRLAQARKLRFSDYIRRAVIRQVLEDLRVEPAVSVGKGTVGVKVEV